MFTLVKFTKPQNENFMCVPPSIKIEILLVTNKKKEAISVAVNNVIDTHLSDGPSSDFLGKATVTATNRATDSHK